MKELEYYLGRYEFEDRANYFMAEVVTLSEKYPGILVDAENKTIEDLDLNAWAIKKSSQLKRDEMHHKAFFRGLVMDAESADIVTVLISIRGNTRMQIREFQKKVTWAAKHYSGIRTDDNVIREPEDAYKFFTSMSYNFKA